MSVHQIHNAICCIIIIQIFGRQQTNGASLINSYLPASMQALAYYIDLLQYEPLSVTTIEPPFSESAAQDDSTENIHFSTVTTTSGWWQPPNWWIQSSTTEKPSPNPTAPHKPALFAPTSTNYLRRPDDLDGYNIFYGLGGTSEGFNNLPLTLIKDIITEVNHDDFNNDVESLDNFLRIYDDNYGRATFDADLAMDRWSSTSTAGKKRKPPTKPYVEFLLVYDLLKRDAKSSNLSKYEGYSDELLKDLNKLSHMSSQRQLYMLFKRMLDRGDIQRSDVVSRIKGIIKELANPNSATVKALRYIPAMPFSP